MKRVFSFIIATVLLIGVFTGCSSKKEFTNEELIAAVNAIEDEELEYNPAIAFDNEDLSFFYELNEFDKDNIKAGAISVSMVNIKAYAVMVLQPKEGCEEALFEDVNEYVKGIQKSFERYLADQYEIALSAVVSQEDNGLIILTMTENSQQAYENIVAALA